ncbi:coiled-coil domain-containing protein [Seramator thermalis]|uniref:hypothetical protein n=1 Tax=Seramator thermalis TaxID=2496270 RepID=UPI00101BA247|nr:hypothetical protein [Seramator thermalis]
MEQPVSEKNTKAQILEAYEKLLKKVEQKSNDNPKEVQQRKQDVQTVEKATKTTEGDIEAQIAKIKSEFVAALEIIEKELADERKKLETIQNAIRIEEKRLDDLYGISVNADSLSAILLAQKEQKEQFEQEMDARKEELSSQITQTRAAWEKEKAEHEAVLKAEKENLAKMRRREEEEYAYTTQQKRKKEEDEYLQMKNRQEAELKERKIAFEKEVAEREKQLKESENELASLRAQAENFESRLSEAVQKAQAETEKRLQSVYAYEKELREKEVQGIINLKDHQIQTLQSKIKEMEQQLKEASAKVDVSEKTVKDIALKAIESANKTQFIEREKVKE